MKKSENKSWTKRITAVVLAACMVLTTPASLLADDMAEESEVQAAAEDEFTSGDIETEFSDISEQSKADGENENQTTDDGFISDEGKSDASNTDNQTDDTAKENQKIQLSLQLLSDESGETTYDQSSTLSLTQADNLSGKITVKDDDKIIEVTDGDGLILLSNVKPKEYQDYTIKLITTAGWDLTSSVTVGGTNENGGTGAGTTTTYGFLGLGSETYPYQGTFQLDENTAAKQYSISTSRALFNALSTKATLSGTIPFGFSENAIGTEKPLLAETIIAGDDKTLKADIALRNLNGDKISEPTIGGLIGTLGANASAKITFTNQFPNELMVTAENHTGLFCNTMETGSSLTAVLKQETGSVKVAAAASEADAGGFVGYMKANSSLTVAGCSVNQVSSTSGNAGGLVGSSTDGTLCVASTEGTAIPFTFADKLTLKAASNKAAGGLIGAYSVGNTQGNSISYDLSHYTFRNFTISSGQNVGGLFGMLNNTSTTASHISINLGNTANASNSVNTAVSDSVTNFGGLIGNYQSSLMANALSIKGNSGSSIQAVSTGGTNISDSYGGIVGTISESSYVEIENVSASTADMKKNSKASFGGLVGKINGGLLNVGNVTLTTVDHDLAADDVDGRGGLVGHLVKGILRLHGTTDLSNQKITTAYNHTGQIVGNNGNGLVYATGNGSSLSDSGEGWKLIRYSGQDRSGSDIGNWGAAVRLGGNLTESSDGVLSFDATAHTVRINNGVGTDIKDANAFAAYALAFDLSNSYAGAGGNAALIFASAVNPSSSQTVDLTGNIDLTGTGILGIGKDSFEKDESAQKFHGTFEGHSHTITLDIGTTYGANVSAGGNVAGQLYARRKGSKDAHYSLALIPFSKDVTISNVTIAGNINCKVPKTVDQETKEDFPAFVSAVIGLADGITTFEAVTVNAKASVSEETGAQELQVWQGGFLGRYDGTTLNFKNCTWESEASLTDERITDHQRIGGFAATVSGGCIVNVEGCTLSGAVTSQAKANAQVGGLIAVSRKNNTINISNLQVSGARITAASTNNTSGGLLGYLWKNTNVVYDSTKPIDNTGMSSFGVKISGSELSAQMAQFGGLVYQATGYWNATAKDSIVFSKGTDNKANTFTGISTKDAPSGLLVGTGLIKVTQSGNEVVESALYLEAGTWGNASDAAYKIDSGAVVLNIENPEYFDELVGTTKKDDAGNSNAVVSLAVRNGNGTAKCIDIESTENTYTGQLSSKYKNGNTRYYYNLDSYRKNNSNLNVDSVTSPENMVLWSVAQYAAVNVRGYFRQGERTDVTITGSINLTGYSYYPVTPLGAVNLGSNQAEMTRVTLDYDGMNKKEINNKPLSDSDHQHYLMQHGLFYHTTHNIAVKNTSFSGTVGKESAADDGTYSSGALIYGSVTGNPVNNIVEISLNNVTLAGIRVTGIAKDDVTYAPLLINQMNQAVKLTVNALSTGDGYTTGDGSGKTTAYAASSLIGRVGSASATKLTLSFSNIALDGRLAEDTAKTTAVQNNGKVPVEYHTTHTIFTKATLLESFMYSSEGTGTYNFNSTDNKVTYGVELTNTGAIGRNPDKQYQYYDGDSYITDEQGKNADEAYVKSRYSSSNFIRYVYTQQNINESKYELDINQKTTGLLKGCGTYGDPYIIEDVHQLSSLAAYIQNTGSVSKFQVIFNSKVLENQTQTAEGYHLSNGVTGTDIIYTWENGAWKNDAGNAADAEKATSYLLNAYYKIDKDITLSAENFGGLGTKDNPFSGVIVGASENTTVALTGTNANKDSFGGLIAYSRGSVVKNLIVDYSQATITMQADSLPGSSKNPFFGGVVGYCMGGDTIIDHVSVNYVANSVTFSGDYQQMIAAGGYVGLVGGATHVTENTDYEKTGGGVVFRNMDGTSNTFKVACADAAASNKTVNMVKQDGTADGKTASNGGNYFYRNPYVGRVLDGYACAERCTVDNTDKNYTIPTLTAGTKDLQVSESGESLNVTVTSAQGLWLLSAIVNSGAGAMEFSGSYTDVDSKFVDAYQYGKPRTASYEGIGTATADAANLSDEAYWGGVGSTAGSDMAKNRVSYLVKNYTTGNTAARLAGKSISADTNIPVMLTFATDSIDMSSYGNGFRGIGSSYGENKKVKSDNCSIPKVYRRNLLVSNINAASTVATTITLNMNQNDYKSEYDNGVWLNQGAGLFVDFHFTADCTVKNLKLSGNIKVGLFDENGKLTYVTKRTTEEHIGVGGFAARTANSSGTVTFDNFHLENITVYGGVMTGGAIGYVDGYSDKKRNVTFKNWTIANGTVSTWVYNSGSTGGLVGWNNSYGKLTITGSIDTSDKENVKNFTVITIVEQFVVADKGGSGAAGGLTGLCECGSMELSNVIVNNLTVTAKNARDVGGLIAAGRENGDKINVTNCLLGTIKVTLSISDGQNTKDNNIGGVIGYTQKSLKISKVTLENNSYISGSRFVGGFVGGAYNNVTIEECKEININVQTLTNWIGGFIGYVSSSKNAIFKKCQENDVNILGRYAGGLVGVIDGNIQASNVEFNRVVVATTDSKESYYAGLITGNAKRSKNAKDTIFGYNILADSCKTGYSKEKVENLPATVLTETNTSGFWIGQSGQATTINLTAVAAKGQVFPQKDIGTNNGSATIIYADASVDQTYQPTDTTATSLSADPWLDVNPKSNVPFADGTVMTGNGVGIAADGGTITAQNILNNINTDAADRYWNLQESANTTDPTYKRFSQFLDSKNDAYVTMYMSEESTTTTVDKNIDFPVFVVNNTADVDSLLWNYIAAMTNVKDGTEAKTQIKDITATTYRWNNSGETGTFQAKDDASLRISTEKKISIVPNAYDNQNSQFTLLDVTYANPTDEKATPFHLYIPVLVKKVLYISFKARFLAGTDYCVSDYPMDDTSANHYATAGFDEPLTAYLEYSYEKETDWQSMVDNGENLLWYYDKILDLAAGSSQGEQTLLPVGTRLTLLDRQTMQYYICTMTGTENIHSFNLASMTVPDSASTTEGSAKAFTPVSICDLLDLTASVADSSSSDGKTCYVVEADPQKAIVKAALSTDSKEIKYFRVAGDSDTDAIKYHITVPDSSKTKARTEGYYLTIQVPTTQGYSVINNRLNYGTFSHKEGTLPAAITSKAEEAGSSYVVYNGVEQTSFKITTSRIHNGKEMGDTIMESGDSIKIHLESKLKLTEAGKGRFNTLGPSQFYHEFDISLKKYLKNQTAYGAIGTELVSYTYTLSGKGLDYTEKKDTLLNAAELETLTLKYGSTELKKALETANDDSSAVIVTADITLTYAGTDHFPARNTSDNADNSGITAVGISRIANTSIQLPITGNKKDIEDKNRYYITNLSKAILKYSTVDQTGSKDTTKQLGINPSDTVNNRSDIIYTKADYDYSNVDAAILEKATSIRYKMQLFQKNSDGTYDETRPLSIASYLPVMFKENTQKSSVNEETTYQWEERFDRNASGLLSTRFRFSPLTGAKFEEKGYTYANYRVRLTVVLLDKDGKEIADTKATDYIIYTNARIYQEILNKT
nr:hypothetical protein [uncultured Blautia sp.]